MRQSKFSVGLKLSHALQDTLAERSRRGLKAPVRKGVASNLAIVMIYPMATMVAIASLHHHKDLPLLQLRTMGMSRVL